MTQAWQVRPLTPERWPDLEALFGAHGAAYGCWCMWWYQTDEEFYAHAGDDNHAALQELVNQGTPLGLLGYVGDQPMGWICVRPRDVFTRLQETPFLAPAAPAADVWAITCFYVADQARGQGLMEQLIAAACEYAGSNGARAVEAYPIDLDEAPMERFEGGLYHSVHAHVGILSAFQRQGFAVVERRMTYRPIVLKSL